jgi:hypothetical protein
MSVFVDPSGHSTFGIGICARCQRAFVLDELKPDPNYPGLYVCKEDIDVLDPYRLPPPMPEKISLRYTRPDVDLDIE